MWSRRGVCERGSGAYLRHGWHARMRDIAYTVSTYILLTGFVVLWTVCMEFVIAKQDGV